jgi:hypothetical protein
MPAMAAPRLRAGAGRADITPQTGYAFGGWTRADRRGLGQHTRLYASAIVLERGGRKVALVAVDLFAAPGGMVKAAADLTSDRGFSQENVLVSASHTHAGPGGFANYGSINTVAPSTETIGDPDSFIELLAPLPADRQLYTFLVNQIAAAIGRADDNKAPAALAWGSASLLGVTRNRSLEAHLANHGVIREPGQGKVEEDPQGYPHTIDPEVNVLRVDQFVRRRGRKRRRIPIGAFSTFANHGTVNPATYQVYNRDHHGPAAQVFEQRVRRAGRVPRRRPVVNVFGNSNEGDQSAGLDQTGPAHAELVGRREADAMLAAWRAAGRRLTRRPELDVRWTRVCFCGQETATGPVADRALVGTPFLTGSEEGRGSLYDITQQSYEGQRNPIETDPSQGHKNGIPEVAGPDSFPHAVPLLVVRVGGRMIVTVPGEASAEVGRRMRAAVLSAVGAAGVSGLVVSGLANEYVLYFTTPEEYDRQHYEGGQSFFGPNSGTFLQEQLVDLAQRLVSGQPAPAPYEFDPENGVMPDGPPYGDGAANGQITSQPADGYARLEKAELGWTGGPNGLDRPVERAFVTVQRRTRNRKGRRRWRAATSDLGLQIVWRVDDQGNYNALWEIPVSAPVGLYRMVITAKRYRLVSNPFRVQAAQSLALRKVRTEDGGLAVQLVYPAPVPLRDFTWRPRIARTVAVGGSAATIGPGGLRDRYGNRNASSLSVVAP